MAEKKDVSSSLSLFGDLERLGYQIHSRLYVHFVKNNWVVKANRIMFQHRFVVKIKED